MSDGERMAISGGGSSRPSDVEWVAGHLDTFHLSGYAVGPFLLVTNSDEHTVKPDSEKEGG